MIIYLPLGLSAYKDAFKDVQDKEKSMCTASNGKARHHIYHSEKNCFLIPESLDKEVICPENFFDLISILTENELWIIDRVKFSTSIDESTIQIVDHRNLTGWNPLIGKTPLHGKPYFPDVSMIYNKTNIGLQQVEVSTVGLSYFKNVTKTVYGSCVSELAALLVLAAGYAGFRIYAIGWNQKNDPMGLGLADFLNTCN
ncbi:MAG: hypothetical protein IIA61_10185 [Candidatus Marinimicrobia bacterium]|nr:hypothetical protein [Candidatus Neomarinimicrobiota bacterium]